MSGEADPRLDRIRDAIRKKFKDASVGRMADGSTSDVREVIPTGIDILDRWILGTGGLPVGRIVELWGAEASGKSSLGFHCLAATQKLGGLAMLYESESTLMVDRGRVFGLDPEHVLLLEPLSLESLIDQLRANLDLIPDGVGPNLIVWDSLAATSPENEIEGDAGESRVGSRAQLLSKQLPLITKMLTKKRTCMVIVNQVRQLIGVKWGPKETAPGGNAVKHFTTIRVQMWAGTKVKHGEDVVGQETGLKCVKNKLALPHRKANLRLDYLEGWDNMWSTVTLAKDRGVIGEKRQVTEATYQEALEALKKVDGWYAG